MTSWGDEESVSRTPRSQTGGLWSGRSKSAPPTWREAGAGQAGAGKSSYWTPGGAESGRDNQPASKPITRKSATPQPAAKGKFERRDSVQHASFGVGTVIESNMTRDGEEVTVAFPGVGIKKLLAEYLRKL
jgi:DNA helicase-2/ATP-dependent DNA helicase PcrA